MPKEYNYPALTADIILFSTNEEIPQVLLIKRGKEPFKDKWALPGGFMEENEELEDAAKRELEEETNIKNLSLNQLGAFGKVGRDPRGRTVSIVYWAFVDASKISPKAGDDAKEACWFSIDNLPELAFDHAEIINYAIRHLCL